MPDTSANTRHWGAVKSEGAFPSRRRTERVESRTGKPLDFSGASLSVLE